MCHSCFWNYEVILIILFDYFSHPEIIKYGVFWFQSSRNRNMLELSPIFPSPGQRISERSWYLVLSAQSISSWVFFLTCCLQWVVWLQLQSRSRGSSYTTCDVGFSERLFGESCSKWLMQLPTRYPVMAVDWRIALCALINSINPRIIITKSMLLPLSVQAFTA